MKVAHKKIIIGTYIAVTLLGLSFIAYAKFLDGIYINPILSDFSPRTYQTDKAAYTAGDNIIIHLTNFCKLRTIRTTVTWYLEDDVQLPYTPQSKNLKMGCYTSKDTIDIGLLPSYIGSRNYRFVGEVTYHLFGHDIASHVSTNYFPVKSLKK